MRKSGREERREKGKGETERGRSVGEEREIVGGQRREEKRGCEKGEAERGEECGRVVVRGCGEGEKGRGGKL